MIINILLFAEFLICVLFYPIATLSGAMVLLYLYFESEKNHINRNFEVAEYNFDRIKYWKDRVEELEKRLEAVEEFTETSDHEYHKGRNAKKWKELGIE